MALIQLRHERRLHYLKSDRKVLPVVPEELILDARARGATLVTFRPLAKGRADQVRRGMHACMRLIDLPATDLVFHGVESDSPLAPLLLWDAAHFLPVGRSITLTGETGSSRQYETDYYRSSMSVESKDARGTVFRKVAMLAAEKDAGLDRWTFGIPVGPEDATLLNVVVKRVLELDIAHKEILLCGRPNDNFKYWDKVRIVGEDITAPPLQICKKKNRLAKEAQFENLCLLHDRVFLPSNFGNVIRRFGDRFPFVGFQSMFFDDRFNLLPRRYSDSGYAPTAISGSIHGMPRDNDTRRVGPFTTSVLAATEKAGYFFASAMRHSPFTYLTGSLYLCKKSVWLACPQDETLYWTELEDVEQAFRATSLGIPSRINPFSFTQSLIGRPLLSIGGMVQYESISGTIARYRPALEAFPLPRKPLLKVTREKVLEYAATFQKRYVPVGIRSGLPPSIALRTDARLAAVFRLTNGATLPIRRNEVLQFAKDVEKLLLLDQLPDSLFDYVERDILQNGNLAVRNVIGHDVFVNHAIQRPDKNQFPLTLDDYLVSDGPLTYIGSLLSALMLSIQHRKAFYLPGTPLTTFRNILRSTPFKRYARAEAP